MGRARSPPVPPSSLPSSLAASAANAAMLAVLAELQALLHRRRCLGPPAGGCPLHPAASSISEDSVAPLYKLLPVLALLPHRSRVLRPAAAPLPRPARASRLTSPASRLLACTSWMSRRAPSTLNMGRQSALRQEGAVAV